MKIITSIHNEEIKLVAALKKRKEREEQGRFIAEGLRVITAFIQAGWKPTMLYTTDAMLAQAQELVRSFSERIDFSQPSTKLRQDGKSIPPSSLSFVEGATGFQKCVDESNITMVSPEVMKKMSQAITPSQLLALFRIPVSQDIASIKSGLVMANLCDPGNVGTLMRTCAAMNVQSVVMVEGVDPWHPKVIQATAGTIAQLNIFQWTWQELIAHKGDLKLYALTVSGGKKPEAIEARNALLVVGNEAHGLPEQWVADCDDAITIPMPGNTESLNAAVAGSIALYLTFKR